MTTIHPAVRAELDETPEWWDAQFRKLARKQISTDAAAHEGHRIVEDRRLTVATPDLYCDECGVKLDDPGC